MLYNGGDGAEEQSFYRDSASLPVADSCSPLAASSAFPVPLVCFGSLEQSLAD